MHLIFLTLGIKVLFNKYLYGTYYVPGIDLSGLQILTHSIFITTHMTSVN